MPTQYDIYCRPVCPLLWVLGKPQRCHPPPPALCGRLGLLVPSFSPLVFTEERGLVFSCAFLAPFVLGSRARFGRANFLVFTPATVLSLLDGPRGADPAFHLVWNRFHLLKRYLDYRPDDVSLVFGLLDLIAVYGAGGHGTTHLLAKSAAGLGFVWDGDQVRWLRPGLPPMRMLAGPLQHFDSGVEFAWQLHGAELLSKRQGFRVAEMIDLEGSLRILKSTERLGNATKCFFVPCKLVVLNEKTLDACFVMVLMVVGTFILGVSTRRVGAHSRSPRVPLSLLRLNRSEPWCLLTHGWLPALK